MESNNFACRKDAFDNGEYTRRKIMIDTISVRNVVAKFVLGGFYLFKQKDLILPVDRLDKFKRVRRGQKRPGQRTEIKNGERKITSETRLQVFGE